MADPTLPIHTPVVRLREAGQPRGLAEREAARVLAGLGADVDLRIYPSRPHVVSNLELAEARVFLRSRMLEVPA